MLGILLSFCEGLFPGAMSVSFCIFLHIFAKDHGPPLSIRSYGLRDGCTIFGLRALRNSGLGFLVQKIGQMWMDVGLITTGLWGQKRENHMFLFAFFVLTCVLNTKFGICEQI